MKSCVFVCAVLLLATLSASAVFAAVPQTISYQGYLTDSSGQPMNGTVGMTFSLYNVATGGSALWTEGHSVTVTNGVHSVILGGSSLVPVPITLPFDQQYYLGIRVGSDPEMSPRQKLTSGGYAIRSGYADSVQDSALTANVALLNNAQTVSGLKTFDPSAGAVPFSVGAGKTGLVTGLNADSVDGNHATGLTRLGVSNTFSVGTQTIQTGATGTVGLAVKGSAAQTANLQEWQASTGAALASVSATGAFSGDGSALTSISPASHNHETTDAKLGGNPSAVSLGTTGAYDLTLKVNNVVGFRLMQTGTSTPNVIGGYSTNSTTAGVMGAVITGGGGLGVENRVTDSHGFIGGGMSNIVGNSGGTLTDAACSVVAGGEGNVASGSHSAVAGGTLNTASGVTSGICGGSRNTASGMIAAVAGGKLNLASGDYSSVAGGESNTAGNAHATVSGGKQNTSSGTYSIVGGGNLNTASGSYASVPGGISNTAQGNFSFAAGSFAKALHQGTFVWSYDSSDFASTASNQFLIKTGAVGIDTNAPAAKLHIQENVPSDVSYTLKLDNQAPKGAFPVGTGILFSAGGGGVARGKGALLYVADDTWNRGRFFFYQNSTADDTDAAAGSIAMAIDNTGKVGIGTPTPSANLDVENVIRVYGVPTTTWPSAGKGLELAYNSSTNKGYIQAYDRSGSTWGTLDISASTVHIGGSPGNLSVAGTLSKGSGSFRIDHPLDPRNKYLYHSFVESPDMKNIYDGVVTTDESGYATVVMPDWFEALNREFRYQLTVIGNSDTWARARVFRKIENGTLVIQTDVPGTEVSWQVTGIRKDAYAEAHRIKVEEEKPDSEKGTCLHQEACVVR
jgi:hypothetical protein